MAVAVGGFCGNSDGNLGGTSVAAVADFVATAVAGSVAAVAGLNAI